MGYGMGMGLWNGYGAMEWVWSYGMGMELWDGYGAMGWVWAMGCVWGYKNGHGTIGMGMGCNGYETAIKRLKLT
jgi:hypothetical protein